MTNINNLVRENIRNLVPYSSARDEFTGKTGIFLDANENPFGDLNRYPDPYQRELKDAIGKLKGIETGKIFLGNGSDEIIDLCYRTFCNPGKDMVLLFSPSYGMYAVSAAINDVMVKTIPLKPDFQIDINAVRSCFTDERLKLVFICSPNNPTGNCMNPEDITFITENFGGIVVLDEAYIDFSDKQSFCGLIDRYPNLIVMQTFSKAMGLAAVRIGMAFMNPEIVGLFNKVKPPYNMSTINQKAALRKTERADVYKDQIKEIRDERERVAGELKKLDVIEHVYPSDANFLLVKVKDAGSLYNQLAEKDIIVRNRSNAVKNCLRITIGTRNENDSLIAALQGRKAVPDTGRRASVERNTAETRIAVEIDLDGSGKEKISTGIGFFDHMLRQVACHGNFDLSINAKGDLDSDEHHLIEDVGIVLGEAFLKATGDKRGIERFGFLLPMDDSLAQVAVDFGGRPWLVWDAAFAREKIGEMPTEMVFHFFKSFSDSARCNLNIKAEGNNEHHKIEAIFKAFAKALKMAVRQTDNNKLPTTKGSL